MVLRAVGIAVARIHYFTVAIDYKHGRNHRNAQCTFEVAVGVEQYFVFPFVLVYQRFHFVYVLSLVDRDGI